MGRSAIPAVLEREGPFDYVSAGDIGVTGQPKPRPLTLEEIASYKKSYAVAAKNAIAAGFDGWASYECFDSIPSTKCSTESKFVVRMGTFWTSSCKTSRTIVPMSTADR